MDRGIIAKRYAKAIFQYASEHGEETRLYEEMKMLSEQFLAVPMLTKVLDDPTVPGGEKINALIAAAGKDIGNTYRQVAQMVVENGRGHYMQSIARVYGDVYRKRKNVVIVRLATVQPINDETKNELINLIVREKERKVDCMLKTDDDLIGGFVLEVEDTRLDASVKNQLNQLRLELVKN